MWNISQPNLIPSFTLPRPFYVTDFTPAALKSFSYYLINIYDLELPFAVLQINSEGGDVSSMNGFLSLMENYRKKGLKFIGVVPGFAFSAGAVVFLFCDNDFRWMGASASLMIHNSQVGHLGDRVSSVKNFTDFVHGQDRVINEKLSKHLKKRGDWLDKEMKKRNDDDWNITAQDAETLGFAKIGIPSFNVNVHCEFSINE